MSEIVEVNIERFELLCKDLNNDPEKVKKKCPVKLLSNKENTLYRVDSEQTIAYDYMQILKNSVFNLKCSINNREQVL